MGCKCGQNADGKNERRIGERRIQKRRAENNTSKFDGVEKRSAANDRRMTIFNRHNIEVTDRRMDI